MNISKELFCKVMRAVEKQYAQDDETEEALTQALPGSHVAFRTELSRRIIELLDEYTNNCEWVHYWVYDLDFGKNSTELSVVGDGEPVPLKTPEQLYDFLEKEKNDE